jgi:hypothetical protein
MKALEHGTTARGNASYPGWQTPSFIEGMFIAGRLICRSTPAIVVDADNTVFMRRPFSQQPAKALLPVVSAGNFSLETNCSGITSKC